MGIVDEGPLRGAAGERLDSGRAERGFGAVPNTTLAWRSRESWATRRSPVDVKTVRLSSTASAAVLPIFVLPSMVSSRRHRSSAGAGMRSGPWSIRGLASCLWERGPWAIRDVVMG
jgi:hypothetical protein